LDIQLDVDEVRVERARLGDPTRAARPKIRPPLGRQIRPFKIGKICGLPPALSGTEKQEQGSVADLER